MQMNQIKCSILPTSEGIDFLIFDEIGGTGTSAKYVSEMLSEHTGKPINVRINSGGGLAFDGLAIYNALRSHNAPVTTTIEGLAGSAAAIIAFAGKPLKMYQSSNLFIHKAIGLVMGNEAVLRDTANIMTKLDEQIANIIANRSGMPATRAMQYMRGDVDGTIFNATEAKALNLADEIIGEKNIRNAIDTLRLRSIWKK